MKRSKKIISVLLVLLMLAGIQVPVYAAKKQEVDMTVTVDKTSVKVGENVTFTFSYDRPVNDVVSSQFYVEYDKNVFTYNKATSAMPEEYAATSFKRTILKWSPRLKTARWVWLRIRNSSPTSLRWISPYPK